MADNLTIAASVGINDARRISEVAELLGVSKSALLRQALIDAGVLQAGAPYRVNPPVDLSLLRLL